MNMPHDRQDGQAMAEGLLVLLGLAMLWMAVSWLYRLQDIALTAQHATSYLAFTATRRDGDLSRLHGQFFAGPGHQWRDRTGLPMLAGTDADTRLEVFRLPELAQAAQPGSSTTLAAALRKDWHLDDEGVLDVHLTVTPQAVSWGSSGGKSAEPAIALGLQRHTAILTAAGHASEDNHAQQVLVQSGQAWGHSASVSYGLSERIRAVMGPVDSAWGRALPEPEWTSSWAGRVPTSHLRHANMESK